MSELKRLNESQLHLLTISSSLIHTTYYLILSVISAIANHSNHCLRNVVTILKLFPQFLIDQ